MSKQRINLFYLSGNTTGGWVTYTTHLMLGLLANGVDVQLFKIGNRTEDKRRDFGYGLQYRNLCLTDAIDESRQNPTVITALQKNSREKAAALAVSPKTWLMFYDPAEKANLATITEERVIITRKIHNQALKGRPLVIHPYVRKNPPGTMVAKGADPACSICRIDFDKHTHILLDANRLLPDTHKIMINGFENRLYTRFKIAPKYPEWEQSKAAYPRERYSAVDICSRYEYTVDMSLIKGDGGGVQYAFLEAMDAGSVNIIHKDWVKPLDEMRPGLNCMVASDGESLAKIIRTGINTASRKKIVKQTDALLARHEATAVTAKLLEVVV